MTTLVNIKRDSCDVLIDRSSPYGNPHPIGWCAICRVSHSRREAVERYYLDFKHRLHDREWRLLLQQLDGKILGCHCKPQLCHGDVIVEYLTKTGRFAPEEIEKQGKLVFDCRRNYS